MRKPSALRPLAVAAALAALAWLLRERAELNGRRHPALLILRPRGHDEGPPTRGAPERTSIERSAAAPVVWRDALKSDPAAVAPAPLGRASAESGWDVIASEQPTPVMAARRDGAGRVHVTYGDEPAAEQAALLAPEAARRVRESLEPSRGIKPTRLAPARHPRAFGSPSPASLRAARGEETTSELDSPAPALPEDAPEETAYGGAIEEEAPALAARIRGYFAAARRRREERRRRGAAGVRASARSLLGKGVLRPPPGELKPPSFAGLDAPRVGLDGRPLAALAAGPRELERLKPPEGEKAYRLWSRDARRGRHWHAGPLAEYLHQKRAWGVLTGDRRWTWMVHSGDHWWADGPAAPLVWHAEHWWWKEKEGWFLLHGGQAWAYRFFGDLKRDGLFEPGSRARLIYSEDAQRVALLIPGEETIVYELATGRELGRFSAEKANGRSGGTAVLRLDSTARQDDNDTQ